MVFDFKKLFGKCNNDEEICNVNKSKKLFFTAHESLSISAKTNATAQEVSEIANNLMHKYRYQPKMVLNYIASNGTKIVHAPKLLSLLKFLGYEDGFIPKHKDIQAFILNICVSKFSNEKVKFSFEAPEMLIICSKELSLYFLAYNLHHWLAYHYNLPGYEWDTWKLFKIAQNNKINYGKLSINQVLSLKDAVERDKQAIDFVTKFVSTEIGAKEKLDSILQGKKVSI